MDHSVWTTLAVTVAAYLLGSLSFAVIISRVMGLSDPRSYGSNNPGATNVLRSGNKKAAVFTLILDAAKGWLPVFAVQHFGGDYALGAGTAALAAIAAFLGHLYPLFFRFKGGKGVATAAGVLLGVNPLLGLSVALTWAIVAWFFRYSSLAALAAAVFAPAYYAFGGDVAWPYAEPLLGALIVMSLLLVWRHIDNINRLVAGKESKLGAKKK